MQDSEPSQDAKPYIIVVGVDYSDTSDLALLQAFRFASAQPNSEVHAVSVASVRVPMNGFEPGPEVVIEAPSVAQSSADLRDHVQRRLDDYHAMRPDAGYPARIVTHVRSEAPSEEIAQLASDLEADLVIVGTHGRRGISRMLLGSVAEGVVRLAPCPVLVVRHKQIVEGPRIEPPCPECVKTRRATKGTELWCEQHRERHGQRHTYRSGDRVSSDGTMPLVVHSGDRR
jgi:nucleotide-binding universal stress UspA family protein